MKQRLFLFLLLAMPLFCMAQSNVVNVKEGKLEGVASGNPDVVVFKGVPYAQPPVGDLRWKAPQPMKAWKGVKRCDKFGNISWQNGQEPGSFYEKEFYMNDNQTKSEDCLYLNVWVPKKALANKNEKMPVAFWVHGGAYINGYGHEMTMDGDAWAQRGVILVTINYRLGILGFLCHPELSKENKDGVSGNYGLLDQIAALQWVHDNISKFGGNPDNITVFGQSAGAASVKNLVISPLSKGLIRHCIIQSGGGLGKFIENDKGNVAIDAAGKEMMDKLGLTDIDKMRNAAPEDIVKIPAWGVAHPHNDGIVLTKNFGDAVTSGEAANIDYMIGCTLDDLRPMNKEIDAFCYARDSVDSTKGVYQYLFARKLPGSKDGAFHSSELWYIFHTLNRSWRPMTSGDNALADEMMDFWTNFCKCGNPNGQSAETWHPFTAKNPFVMTLNVK